jgi:hypothetical protein
MKMLNLRIGLWFLLPLSLLFITACTPLMHSTRNGDQVNVVSNDGPISCTPIIFFWGRAEEECKKLGKNSSFDPSSVTTTKNRFCQSDGVYKATYTCLNSSESTQKSAPSRLELRAMQTRKLSKTPQVVITAISELYKDNNMQCSSRNVSYKLIGYRMGSLEMIPMPGVPGGKTGNYNHYFKGIEVANPGVIRCTNGDTYELRTDPVLKQDGKEFVLNNTEYSAFVLKLNYGGEFTNMPNTTIVRARIMSGDKKQSTDPKTYQNIFKKIADGLFIDAIHLNPAEMQ